MSMTKSDLLEKAAQWTKKADKLKGPRRARALKNAAAYRWRANKLTGGVKKKVNQITNHIKQVVSDTGHTYFANLFPARPFEDADIKVALRDNEGRGDIVIAVHDSVKRNGTRALGLYVELKQDQKSVWIFFSEASTMSQAMKILCDYLARNVESKFYE